MKPILLLAVLGIVAWLMWLLLGWEKRGTFSLVAQKKRKRKRQPIAYWERALGGNEE